MTESNLTSDPAISGSDLGLELLRLMEVAILCRVLPRSYDLKGLIPDFYTRFFPPGADGAACNAPWNHSPMLDFFLGEAEDFFESGPKPGESLSSGLWVENLDSGEELPLMATARVLKNSQLLLVQTMRDEYAQRVRLTRRSQADLRSRMDLREKRKILTNNLLKNAKKKNPFDPITKLYNREALMDLLQAQIANLPIYAPNLSLIMMSLDQLEGSGENTPAEGNDLLRQLGQILRRFLRKSDAAAHCGGGVFFIVATGTALPQAIMAAERLNAIFKGYDFGLGRPVRPYMGCTSYRPGEEPGVFVARARQALLDAVRSGPDTVGQRDPLEKTVAGSPA